MATPYKDLREEHSKKRNDPGNLPSMLEESHEHKCGWIIGNGEHDMRQLTWRVELGPGLTRPCGPKAVWLLEKDKLVLYF